MNSSLRITIFERDNWTCRFCGLHDPDGRLLTVDHVIPLSRGGHPMKKANLLTACFPCNQKKANQTPDEADMHIISEGYDYTPPGKLDDGKSDMTLLVLVNQGYGRKRRKKMLRRRRKELVKYWERYGTLPEDLTEYDVIY